jgi:hypothetical protein
MYHKRRANFIALLYKNGHFSYLETKKDK